MNGLHGSMTRPEKYTLEVGAVILVRINETVNQGRKTEGKEEVMHLEKYSEKEKYLMNNCNGKWKNEKEI